MAWHTDDNGPDVLFITRKWAPAVGGMETYCQRLTEELSDTVPVEVIALSGRKNGQPPRPTALALFPFSVLHRIARIRIKPTIVHLGDMAIWPLGLMARLFFPSAHLILSAHGTDVSYGLRGGLKGSAFEAFQKLGAWLLPGARTIANSDATRRRLGELGWHCVAKVPLATDLDAPAEQPVETNTIVFAGRLVQRKGCAWFINRVLPLLPDNTRLTVIGTVWDASEQTALNHPQVEFLGGLSQSQLVHHFARAGCVIVPNIDIGNGEFEGFGLVAPEAASAGGVVLAAATGGLTDAVIDGETGFLLPPGNAQDWADKIVEIAGWSSEKRTQFTRQSRLRAKEHFNWKRVAQATLAAYTI